MIDSKYEAALAKAFRDVHGCEATHIQTVPVVEVWNRKTVWEGDVEVFDLTGHPKATRGFAWAYDKRKKTEIVAMLELPPVISPRTAVATSIVGMLRAQARG